MASKADTLRFVDARFVAVTKMREIAFLVYRGRRDLTGLVIESNRIRRWNMIENG